MRARAGMGGAAVALLVALAPAQAIAQTTSPQLAQSLFEQARRLMAAQRFKEACPLLAESQRLDPGGGTLLNLAICHEGEGKPATAWTEFNAALSEALRDGRKGREQLARQHILALEPKLSHLTVTVPAGAEVDDLTVTLDGITVGRGAWGISAAVDPGMHKVEAKAPGRRGWSALVVMGSAETQTVEVPALAPDGTQAAPTCPGGMDWNGVACLPRAAPAPVPPPVIGPPPPPHVYQPIGPIKVSSTSPFRYTVGALALGALGTSLVTGIVAWVDHDYANDHCDADRQYCDGQEAIDRRSQARTWAWVSTVTLGAGAVGAAGYLLWPNQTKIISGITAAPVYGGAVVFASGTL